MSIKKSKKIVKSIFIEDKPIEFHNVTYVYNKKTIFKFKALDDINLNIKPNIVTAIIGSTGSGKSTLVQHINGLLLPHFGKIKIGDFEITKSKKKQHKIKSLRKTIGLVFQFPEYQLFEETVEKDVMFGPLNMGQSFEYARKISHESLKLVDIDEKLFKNSPFNLSGGQKRRVAIAGILALEGTTLVLDEPTAGLDPQGELSFIDLFKSLNKKEKKRIIIISHNMDNILSIADEIIVMDKGLIKFQGSPFDIFLNKKLITDLGIELPKIYSFIHKLEEKGFNFKNKKVRTIKNLVDEIEIQIKGS